MLKFFQLNLTFKYIDKYKVQSSTARKCWVGQKMRKLRLKPLKGRFWRHLVAILLQNNSNLKTKIDRFKQVDFRREWPSDVTVYTVHFLWLEIMLDMKLAVVAILTALNISCTGFQEVSGLATKFLASLHVTYMC